MNTNAPIIAGIDFSAPTLSVLRHAIQIAARSGVPVVALHVLDSGSLAHRAASGGLNPAAGLLEKQARERLAGWIAAEDAETEIRIEIRKGRPAEELQRSVEEHGASLLVIAANDTTKKRLGSIASHCVRSVPCDVMVLRDWQQGNFTKIIVCSDFSPAAAHALARGVSLAAAHGAELEVVHVIYPPSRDAWGEVLEHEAAAPMSYVEECRAKVDEQMMKSLSPHAEALATIKHRTVILESVLASAALTYHIQDTGADLVVLGTRSHSKLASYFIGTNAERLLHDATVSILAVRG